MDLTEHVDRIRGLSNDELIERLGSLLGSSLRLSALTIAHLGEVEERRLHLLSGHESLFAYCTARLGMSEDEAYRRIEVARLARRFPALLERLASGLVTLSVAALLKACLNDANHVALLSAVSNKTVQQAREALAAWFPRPDVPSSVRKLPERRLSAAPGERALEPGAGTLFESASPGAVGISPPTTIPTNSGADHGAAQHGSVEHRHGTTEHASAQSPASFGGLVTPNASPSARATRRPAGIDPLSPERYRVQFTADGELKRKLDLARDLLRHSVPSGDLATLVGRALDLLIETTMKRRFGTPQEPKAKMDPGPRTKGAAAPPSRAGVSPVAGAVDEPQPPSPRSKHLPSRVRRAVAERDGLRCTWRGPDGTRCESRTWLEHDHILPRGLGGTDAPENVRIRCRAHNQLAAEQTFGKAKIASAIARRRSGRKPAPMRRSHDVVAPAHAGEPNIGGP